VRSRLAAPVGLLALVLMACSGSASPPGSAQGSGSAPPTASPSGAPAADLTIYGAASLKGVLEKAQPAYEAAFPGTTLTISTDSSAALETQIEQGPRRVFLSADTANPQSSSTRAPPMGTPSSSQQRADDHRAADNPAGIQSPVDSPGPGVKVIAAGDEVPITKYASKLIANLASEAGYPADFAAGYAANVVSKEDNVKAVVAKVELGEGDAGIVYVTDAAASSAVATIDVPDAANVPATYAGVVVKASPNLAAGRAFLTWFAGSGGRAILAGFGFLPPS